MAENNNNGNGGPVDPPGGPPPGAPENASTIRNIARTALSAHPLADSVAVATIAEGFAVQVIYRRKDLK